ncbi:MAG: RNA polymerase sporulation sigma factor SigH [Actinomycetota bacterium]|jgi:RNA polymerase sporulation-specific sigma factor|nr:RNA polymerase sporulation sigma factor SigH [Actinomycetota bacterium]PLS76099.1 MAG: RNA polymerase sporulation sigma factor SigH [Actinomycetota bacterium]
MANIAESHTVQHLTDVELVERFHDGDEEALHVLVLRYRRLIWGKARGYFLVGGDADDIEQEGMIGLFKAVRDFRPDRRVSFRAFADVCVTRQMITAVKTATRRKHEPLNRSLPIAGPRADEEPGGQPDDALVDTDCLADPLDAVIAGEQLAAIRAALDELLSGLEVDVLRLYLEGRSYEEISLQLGRHVKSVDNALQRIKRKLEGHLQDHARASLPLAVA